MTGIIVFHKIHWFHSS